MDRMLTGNVVKYQVPNQLLPSLHTRVTSLPERDLIDFRGKDFALTTGWRFGTSAI